MNALYIGPRCQTDSCRYTSCILDLVTVMHKHFKTNFSDNNKKYDALADCKYSTQNFGKHNVYNRQSKSSLLHNYLDTSHKPRTQIYTLTDFKYTTDKDVEKLFLTFTYAVTVVSELSCSALLSHLHLPEPLRMISHYTLSHPSPSRTALLPYPLWAPPPPHRI